MGKIITFYSYKGGVGRSMCLANVAAVLADWGYKILAIDWDLEAPGLENFYQPYLSGQTKLEVKKQIGVIDLLNTSMSELENANTSTIFHVNIKKGIRLDMISSGRRDENYFAQVRKFNVDHYYENGGAQSIEKLAELWKKEYDFVLIDSRTGITEIGGITTIQLPDILVLLFTATLQGLEGIVDVAKRTCEVRSTLPFDKKRLLFLPVPSRYDSISEFKLATHWLSVIAQKTASLMDDWLPAKYNRYAFLEMIKIPYKSYFSFGEKLPVIEEGTNDPTNIGYAYENIALLLKYGLDDVSHFFEKRPLKQENKADTENNLKKDSSNLKTAVIVVTFSILAYFIYNAVTDYFETRREKRKKIEHFNQNINQMSQTEESLQAKLEYSRSDLQSIDAKIEENQKLKIDINKNILYKKDAHIYSRVYDKNLDTLNKQKLESQYKIQSIQDSLLQLILAKQSAIDSLYQIQNGRSSFHQQ